MKLRQRFHFIIFIMLGLLVGGSWPLLSHAASQATNNVGFSVQAKLPKNQLDKKHTFFDLKMRSGQTETLQATIYNQTNQEIKVATAIHTAWTNSAGVIDYTNVSKHYDTSLQYKMSDLSQLQGPKTVTIPARQKKVVTVKVKIPKTDFQGVILGGWFFKRVDQKVTGTVKGANNIRNAYAYAIGMKYTLGKVPSPRLALGKVQAGTYNYHRGIIVNLRNPSAVIVPDLKMDTKITSQDSQKVIKHLKQKNVQMAPNTDFRYPMLSGEKRLAAGKYHLHMVVKNSAHRWVFDRDFTITSAQADKVNAAVGDNQGLSIWLILALGALAMLLLVLLIILIIFLVRRRKQNQAAK